MKSYPSWRYHASKPACVVQDAAEDAALGRGWFQSPADVFQQVTAEPEPPTVDPGPVTINEKPTARIPTRRTR